MNKPLRYLSVCSGMEAATVAWHHMGWQAVGFSEIEPFPSAILKHHYPTIPNYGDLTQYKQWPIEQGTVDLLVGGTPCQAFSVAGLRKGLDDPRGNLALTFLGLAEKLQPTYILWENVPGVLSSNKGRDFASFIGALAQLGYGFAWRVLDAQYFGVPQRRRRIFVVGCLGNWRTSAEILSLAEGVSGYIEKGDKKRKGVATNAGASVEAKGKLIPFRKSKRAQSVNDETLVDDGKSNTLNNFNLGDIVNKEPKPLMFKIRGGSETNTGEQGGTIGQSAGKGYLGSEDKAFTIATASDQWLATQSYVAGTLDSHYYKGPGSRMGGEREYIANIPSMSVRRLTPRECERLQGFPDNYSQIPWKGKPAEQCPDGPRYKACGNSMAVPVMRWIGERIQKHIDGKL